MTVATLVHYRLLSLWHFTKMHNPTTSYECFANTLATTWGVSTRLEAGSPPAIHLIPGKCTVTGTAQDRKEGARYILQPKRLADAIIKATIVSVINQHYKGKSLPKCAIIDSSICYNMSCASQSHNSSVAGVHHA